MRQHDPQNRRDHDDVHAIEVKDYSYFAETSASATDIAL